MKKIIIIGIHFHFVIALSICYNCKTTLQKIIFNGSLSIKFFTCKKNNHEEFFFSLKFSIIFPVVKFISNALKTLVSTFVIIMMKIVIF